MKEKEKEQEYTNMLNKPAQPTRHKNKMNNKNKNNNNLFFYDILNVSSFSLLFILSWFSLKWLHLYQYIFTIHRYINYGEENNEYEFGIINDKLSKIAFAPILLNSILLLIGKIIYQNYYKSQYFFFIGLILGLLSLFILLKINLEEKLVTNSKINDEINIFYIIFKEYFFQLLLAIDLYYCFYVICQIISYLINNYEIQNFLGIIANLSLGIVSIYINYKLKSIGNSLFFGILFSGILYFQFTIRPQEREEIKLGYGEALLSGIFLFFSFIEFFYNIIYKYTSDN